MAGVVTFHFDGPIADNHEVSLRVLSNTLSGFQGAIDRAYLDIKYGNVWKYARLKREDYEHTDFIVGRPQDGGYILDLQRAAGAAIIRRIYLAVDAVMGTAFNEGAEEAARLANQVSDRTNQLDLGIYPGRTIAEYRANPGTEALRTYGDRSIVKEIDQVLNPIRGSTAGQESPDTLELNFEFEGEHDYTFTFNKQQASRFHQIVSHRSLGEPLLYTGVLRSIDRGNNNAYPKAKLTLTGTKRDIAVHMRSVDDYQQLAPYMQGNTEVSIYACPILEFKSFDPNAGDVYFLRLSN